MHVQRYSFPNLWDECVCKVSFGCYKRKWSVAQWNMLKKKLLFPWLDFVTKSKYSVCSSLCVVQFLIICFLLATVFTIIIISSLFLSVFVHYILAQLSLSWFHSLIYILDTDLWSQQNKRSYFDSDYSSISRETSLYYRVA